MSSGPHHQIANLRLAPGELSFEARIGERAQEVWLRTDSPLQPTADAALAATLMPAMRFGGTLELDQPISPRVLRTQREFQAIQRTWSWEWEFGDPPLREVEVRAPTRKPAPAPEGRVAAFFSGGVDSWATVLENPDLTDLIFVRGTDILPRLEHQKGLAELVEARLREAAAELGMPLHVVETNVRDLSDPLVRWEAYFPSAMVAVAHFLSPLFERILMASGNDHETQLPIASGRMVNQLWSSEQLEIVDDGGLLSREERLQRICRHPVAQRTLRVCWHNTDGAYNCGRCRKCMLTMISLEALGVREQIATFPPQLDLGLLPSFEFNQRILLPAWEDLLDTVRREGRPDLERAVEAIVARGKRNLGLPPDYRSRHLPPSAPTVRIAVVVPVWRQARYLAGAVDSALMQKIMCGIGVVIINDGCPDPETDRIGRTLRDANPDRVLYLRQPNLGVSTARNAGIAAALVRWPQVETVFPLDADNLLSPHTLAELSARLEEDPDAAWASPTLEFFGAEEGEWRVPHSFLPYRQLFMNQCDAGSLIRREVFDAGCRYDETIRYGFEDWEFFLRAALAGFHGVQAGRCGFRYRRRTESMLEVARERAGRLEAEIRSRHEGIFTPAALTRREHTEAPRFALVLCDRDEVLLTAACDLEPRRLSLAEHARAIAAAGRAGGHVPAITLFSGSAAIEGLGPEALAAGLFDLQHRLRTAPIVVLDGDAPEGREGAAALALRATALALPDGDPFPPPVATVVPAANGLACLPLEALSGAVRLLGTAAREAGPLPPESHTLFFEHRHLDEVRTTYPWSSGQPVATHSGALA